jgi:hypothetical protein
MINQNSFIFHQIILWVGLLSLSFAHNYAKGDSGVWIDVDTNQQTLSVMHGSSVQAIFKNVAIGRYGTTWSKITKDDKTPLGKFKIGWINEKSRYYRFFGLNYPNLDTAKRALDDNRITEEIWLSIVEAKNMGRVPPQNTPLGGYIGIHGIGRGDREIHYNYNWTNGCIALTNEQIDQLGKWIKPGVMVNIR